MPKPTKIEHVETLLWNRWLLIRIHCEDGTVGIGEGGVHGWQRPTKTMVEVMTPYLLGKNPHHIEHHYQFLYRSSHFMGAVVQGAPGEQRLRLCPSGSVPVWWPDWLQEGGRTRRGAARQGHSSQPPLTGQHRRVRPARCLYPQLCPARIYG